MKPLRPTFFFYPDTPIHRCITITEIIYIKGEIFYNWSKYTRNILQYIYWTRNNPARITFVTALKSNLNICFRLNVQTIKIKKKHEINFCKSLESSMKIICYYINNPNCYNKHLLRL